MRTRSTANADTVYFLANVTVVVEAPPLGLFNDILGNSQSSS